MGERFTSCILHKGDVGMTMLQRILTHKFLAIAVGCRIWIGVFDRMSKLCQGTSARCPRGPRSQLGNLGTKKSMLAMKGR